MYSLSGSSKGQWAQGPQSSVGLTGADIFEKIGAYHADNFSYYRRGVVDTASHDNFEQSFHDNVSTQITAYWADATDIRVDVLSRNSGIVAFVFRGGVETPDGAKHDYDGALTYVFKRSGDEWQLVHIHESAYNSDSS